MPSWRGSVTGTSARTSLTSGVCAATSIVSVRISAGWPLAKVSTLAVATNGPAPRRRTAVPAKPNEPAVALAPRRDAAYASWPGTPHDGRLPGGPWSSWRTTTCAGEEAAYVSDPT